MSFNSLSYDNCAYQNRLNIDLSLYKHITDNNKYINNNKCRMVKGIVAGNDVSMVKGDFILLENELRGTTTKATKCPQYGYRPDSNNLIEIPQTITQSADNLDINLLHLPECQMINYKSASIPNLGIQNQCPQSVYNGIQFK